MRSKTFPFCDTNMLIFLLYKKNVYANYPLRLAAAIITQNKNENIKIEIKKTNNILSEYACFILLMID